MHLLAESVYLALLEDIKREVKGWKKSKAVSLIGQNTGFVTWLIKHWAVSSVGQSVRFASERSGVRLSHGPLRFAKALRGKPQEDMRRVSFQGLG